MKYGIKCITTNFHPESPWVMTAGNYEAWCPVYTPFIIDDLNQVYKKLYDAGWSSPDSDKHTTIYRVEEYPEIEPLEVEEEEEDECACGNCVECGIDYVDDNTYDDEFEDDEE